MTSLEDIPIYILRWISILLVFSISSIFTFTVISVVQRDYLSEKNRLARNFQEGNGRHIELPNFSFFAVAQAVEMNPKYLAKNSEQKKVKKIFHKKKVKKTYKKSSYRKSAYYKITGYQAVVGQTDSTPDIAAWNDNIKGAVNVAAVTQNSGFKRGTCLKISGISETYIVLDHFNKRYNGQKKIDLIVSSKSQAHKITGRKKVSISAPGNCRLKRIVNGEVVYQKLRKKRF